MQMAMDRNIPPLSSPVIALDLLCIPSPQHTSTLNLIPLSLHLKSPPLILILASYLYHCTTSPPFIPTPSPVLRRCLSQDLPELASPRCPRTHGRLSALHRKKHTVCNPLWGFVIETLVEIKSKLFLFKHL